MRKILLVVDMQNDFLDTERGALAVPNGLKAVSFTNSLIESGSYDEIWATQDFHPNDHRSFAASYVGRKPFEEITLNGIKQTLWPVHAVAGSWGADFHPSLKTDRFKIVIRKGMNREADSYSAFFENDRTPTGAGALLKREYLLDCVGVALDFCLGFSALDALAFCDNVRVFMEGTAGITQNGAEKMIAELKDRGVKVE